MKTLALGHLRWTTAAALVVAGLLVSAAQAQAAWKHWDLEVHARSGGRVVGGVIGTMDWREPGIGKRNAPFYRSRFEGTISDIARDGRCVVAWVAFETPTSDGAIRARLGRRMCMTTRKLAFERVRWSSKAARNARVIVQTIRQPASVSRRQRKTHRAKPKRTSHAAPSPHSSPTPAPVPPRDFRIEYGASFGSGWLTWKGDQLDVRGGIHAVSQCFDLEVRSVHAATPVSRISPRVCDPTGSFELTVPHAGRVVDVVLRRYPTPGGPAVPVSHYQRCSQAACRDVFG